MGNPRTVVFHLQHGRFSHAQNHVAAHGCVGQRIVHQVTEQLVEQGGLAVQPHRQVRFKRQRHAARMRQGCHRHAQLTRQLAQIQ